MEIRMRPTGLWVWLTMLGMLLCGCSGSADEQAKQLALFESIEQQCWRYLGGVKSRFEISGNACGILQGAGSAAGAGTGARGSIDLGSGRQDGSRDSVGASADGGKRRESVVLGQSDELGGEYVKACKDAIGITVFPTASAIKKGACIPDLIQQTCQSYRVANVPDGLQSISKLVVLDSLFSGIFMTRCLSLSSDGISVLKAKVGELKEGALAAAGQGSREALQESFDTVAKKLKEEAMKPENWKAVAGFAFGLFAQ